MAVTLAELGTYIYQTAMHGFSDGVSRFLAINSVLINNAYWIAGGLSTAFAAIMASQ